VLLPELLGQVGVVEAHIPRCHQADDLVTRGRGQPALGRPAPIHFRPAEDVHGYATLFQRLFTQHGLPLALYGDRLNLLVRNDRHWSLAEQLAGRQHPTHLGRILQELGIAYMAAQSPQAKGRVERLWATLQDRLVSELRLRGIPTLEAAEAYLPAFIADLSPLWKTSGCGAGRVAAPAARLAPHAQLPVSPDRRPR
jgi:hypothetical protein